MGLSGVGGHGGMSFADHRMAWKLFSLGVCDLCRRAIDVL
jgi:hypothetical protein